MTEQVKVRGRGDDAHARFHRGEWLTVVKDNGEWVVDGVLVLVCTCPAPVEMYVQSDSVHRRRTQPIVQNRSE